MARGLLTCVLALVLEGAALAWTVEPPALSENGGTSLYAAQSAVSLAQATEIALQRYPGQVVRAETVTRGGRREHQIRVLGADGRVRTVRIDAQTGAFL
jgi:uncharacterized membrane protein YkoI